MIAKQLDYFLINTRYKNWIKNISNHIIANTANPMQHRELIIDLQITLKANYFQNKPDAMCPYDLQKARAEPTLIQHEIENSKLDDTPIANLCGETRNKLLTSLIKKSHKAKKPKRKPRTQYITDHKIKQANYLLFGLTKERGKPLKTNYYLKYGNVGQGKYLNSVTTSTHTTGRGI